MEYVFTLWYPLHARPRFKLAQAHRARRFARRLVHLHRLQRLHHRRIRRRVKVSRIKLRKVNVTKRRERRESQAGGEDDGQHRASTSAAGCVCARSLRALEENARARRTPRVLWTGIERGRVDVHACAAIVTPHGLHIGRVARDGD